MMKLLLKLNQILEVSTLKFKTKFNDVKNKIYNLMLKYIQFLTKTIDLFYLYKFKLLN